MATFSRIRRPKTCSFEIALAEEATDPVTQAYRSGTLGPVISAVELASYLLKPGSRVLDLGAHVGGFALAAAACGCEVIAVEASPGNVDLLRQSVERNRFEQVRIVHAAVHDQPGTVPFSCHGPFGHVACTATNMASVSVPALRVDDLLAEMGWDRVDFIKMDIEGSEVRGVRGMRGLLARSDAPPLFFESNRHTLAFYGENPEALKSALRRLGYSVYCIRRCSLIPDLHGDEQQDVVADFLGVKQLPSELRAWQQGSTKALLLRMARAFGFAQRSR